jgi:carboxymethylenebutenolidase
MRYKIFGGMMKFFTRGVLIFLAVLGSLLLLLVVSVAVDYAIGGQRLEGVSNTLISGEYGGPQVRAYVARPEGDGPFPVVIMIHEFYGLNESIISKAEGLAQEGYFVIAPDTFRGSTTSWIPRAIFQVITTKPESVNADLDSVYAWIETQPEVDPQRIGILGFCYGGRASLEYSLHNGGIAATVVFYGLPETDPDVLENLPGPVLGIFGGADQSIPLEEVRAFEKSLAAAGIPNEITIYEGQPHAFVTNMNSIHAGGVQAEAWGQMLHFLEIYLKNGSAKKSLQGYSYESDFPLRYYAMLVYEHAFGSASHLH